MNVTEVGSSADFPEGEKRSAQVDDQIILLVRAMGKVRAVDVHCPHQHASLLYGTVDDRKITCRMHGAVFDLEDGKVLKGPAVKSLPTLEVEERDGKVFVKK